MTTGLGERELDIMVALWRQGPGTVAEVQARLPIELAYNTVSTILRNLEAKGYVGHTAEGRLFHYHALVSEQTVRGNALSRLVDKLFRGSPLGVVTHMVESQALSPEELRALEEYLDQRLKGLQSASGANMRPGKPKERSGRREE
ncbi:MAG TPA: BlaI/MecI/CopY family transcriptional regulator [Longimicrobiaceae bacterium]